MLNTWEVRASSLGVGLKVDMANSSVCKLLALMPDDWRLPRSNKFDSLGNANILSMQT